MGLSEDQRRHLEGRLREERERVLRMLRRYDESRDADETEAAGDLSDYPFHLADRGSDTYDQEMDAVLAERASREFEAIDDALRRLYETPERFGICEETGAPIPFERLDLVPWTRTCGKGDAEP